MGMPPMNQPAPGGGMGGDAPQPGAGGNLDFASSLRELQQSLPPEMQGKLDPENAITKLLFYRLKNVISEEDGQNLLMLFGNATPEQRRAFGALLPEIIILMDIMDDGELNNSIDGGEDAGMPTGGSSLTTGGPGPGPVPRSTAPRPGPAAQQPGYEADDDEDDYGGGGGSLARLSQVRA